MTDAPQLSIIIPAHNASHYLLESLPSIRASSFMDYEIIVVDDRSTDNTTEVAQSFADRVVANSGAPGPGDARNAGVAHARGSFLLFLDADVAVHPDTIGRIREAFDERRDVAAVFGSYDDEPAEGSVVSSFKNLFHHYVHQASSPDASTFWTGCGAIRREVFERMGGFGRTSIRLLEDVDYGHRLHDAGQKAWLRRDIQVKHLKRWTLRSLIYTDVVGRGIPWTIMLLQRGRRENDLNFTARQKLATIIACLLLPCCAAAAWLVSRGGGAMWLLLPLLPVITTVALNAGLFQFFVNRRGVAFALACVPLLLLYYHYAVVSFVAGILLYYSGRKPDRATHAN